MVTRAGSFDCCGFNDFRRYFFRFEHAGSARFQPITGEFDEVLLENVIWAVFAGVWNEDIATSSKFVFTGPGKTPTT
jgi:hypothetical protein